MGLPTKPVSEYPFAPTTVTEDLRSILDDLRNLTNITDEIKATNIRQLESNEPAIRKGKELLEQLVSEQTNNKDPMRFASATEQDSVSLGPQKPKKVGIQSKDDDGPSLAERMQKTRQEADQKIKEVQAKAQDRGATQAEQDKIVSEGEKIKEKLEQQKKGIKTGFKKGGLASRKK